MSEREDIVNFLTGLGDDTKKLAYDYLLKGLGEHIPESPIKGINKVVVREAESNTPKIEDNWVFVEFYGSDDEVTFCYDFSITCCGHCGKPIVPMMVDKEEENGV